MTHPLLWLFIAALLLTTLTLGDTALAPILRQPIVAAPLLLLGYLLACGYWLWYQPGAQRRALRRALRGNSGPTTLIGYASQTGTAEQLAWQAARQLAAAGQAVDVLPLNEVDDVRLAGTTQALFIASTYGEGDPPDNATLFARRVLDSELDLSHLRCGVLALGDRHYTAFCAFGVRLNEWLRRQQASPLFPLLTADDRDTATLDTWQAQLRHLGAAKAAPEAAAPWHAAHCQARQWLNPGSPGAAAYHLRLRTDTPLHWQAGDILEIRPGHDPALPTREYSLSSIPQDGTLDLLVRQVRHADGCFGLGSGWLTATAGPTATTPVRIRRNPGFHGTEGPMLLIGAGTGLAGLRAHLRERETLGRHDNWLLFGERTAAHDRFHQPELDRWLGQGHLTRLDQVFSRDGGEHRYVQERLAASMEEVRAWLASGAAIFVCGSLTGVGRAVDDTLRAALGDETVDDLITAGRYRRDLY